MNTPIIRPLQLNTTLSYDKKTLIWLSEQDDTVNWSGWPSIVVGINSYNKWSTKQTSIVGIIIDKLDNDNNVESQFEIIHSISKNVDIIAITQEVLSLKPIEYWTDNYNNLINLNDMYTSFPIIKIPWKNGSGNCSDNAIDDAIASLSIILRMNRIVDITPSEDRLQILKSYNISVESGSKPYSIWLFTQYFRHENNRRYKEIKESFSNNYKCNIFDKIVLINEKDYSDELTNIISDPNRVQQIVTGKRLTYYDFFKIVSEYAPDNCIVILANADIYFDDTLNVIHKLNMDNKMLALLRWDVQQYRDDPPILFGPRPDSQDSWVFLSDSIKSRIWNPTKFNYQLGMPGCDNRISADILRMKFLIANPALSIKSYHIHSTNIRNYNIENKIPSDIYVFISPTYIVDMKHQQFPSMKPSYNINSTSEFEIKSYNKTNAITYCTMLEKQGRYNWSYNKNNTYSDKFPVYTWNNSCVTPNGLVYDFDSIYTGKYIDTHNYWANTNTNIFTPLQQVDTMLAIPFENGDVFTHPDTYALQYLSRVSRLLKENEGGSFWIPPNFSSFMQQFSWSSSSVNGVYYDLNSAVFADKVVGLLPGPKELGKEDIDALRGLFPDWVDTPTTTSKKCIVLTNSILSTSFCKQIANVLGNEWNIVPIYEKEAGMYKQICGASLCIFMGGKDTQKSWSKLWTLPSKCCVIEFQQELQIDGQFQHLAHVAGFKSWIYLLSKASESELQNKILESFIKWVDTNSNELIL